jgi:hypothetical protein
MFNLACGHASTNTFLQILYDTRNNISHKTAKKKNQQQKTGTFLKSINTCRSEPHRPTGVMVNLGLEHTRIVYDNYVYMYVPS